MHRDVSGEGGENDGRVFFKKSLWRSRKNAKGRLKIEAVNLSEFKELLDKAEKEACQLGATLNKLHNFEFTIDFSVVDSTSES